MVPRARLLNVAVPLLPLLLPLLLLLLLASASAAAYDVETREGTHMPTEDLITEADGMSTRGEYIPAIAKLQRALQILPKHAQAAFLIGLCAANLAHAPEHRAHYTPMAEEYYLKAIELGRDSKRFENFVTVAHSNVGHLLNGRRDFKAAIAHFTAAIKRKMPNFPDAFNGLAASYERTGRTALAKKAIAKSLAIAPNAALQLHMYGVQPLVFDSQEHLANVSREFVAGFEHLLTSAEGRALHIGNPLKELHNCPHYYLAYHGINYVDTIRTISTVVKRSNPGNTYVAPWIKALDEKSGGVEGGKRRRAKRARRGTGSGGRIKVGFSCMFFETHSVSKFIQGTIANLDRAKFEVVIFSLREPWEPDFVQGDSIQARIRARADRWHDLPKVTIEALRAVIEGERLDVLVYAEIGMDPGNYILSMSRLAPVQLLTHGHASTSGVDEIDYFVSYRPFETADAQTTYTERLVALPTFNYYYRPELPATVSAAKLWASRNIAVKATSKVYTCPQLLVKLSPDFDLVLRELLLADPNAIVVLKTYASAHLDELLVKRLARSFAGADEARSRLIITEAFSDADWFALLRAADVILDSYPFGGYTTSLEALSVGTPVVTLAHPLLMSGRCTKGLLEIMGLPELVAHTREEYVAIAVRLANDKDFRADILERIARGQSKLFALDASVREWETLFEEVVRGEVPTWIHDPRRAARIATGPYSAAAPITDAVIAEWERRDKRGSDEL